ncbi:uncharacterized protein LOC104650407 [Saimiri boliviensis]|uniref:uncharacterized protein LOC104650407 n=1 Tax=Saimiri boliviensis TaxID=27679 RepID=UPI003D7854E2
MADRSRRGFGGSAEWGTPEPALCRAGTRLRAALLALPVSLRHVFLPGAQDAERGGRHLGRVRAPGARVARRRHLSAERSHLPEPNSCVPRPRARGRVSSTFRPQWDLPGTEVAAALRPPGCGGLPGISSTKTRLQVRSHPRCRVDVACGRCFSTHCSGVAGELEVRAPTRKETDFSLCVSLQTAEWPVTKRTPSTCVDPGKV